MTSEFQIQIREKLGFIMAQSISGNGAKFRVNAPNTIIYANLTAMDPRHKALTTISITFKTETLIPMNGYL